MNRKTAVEKSNSETTETIASEVESTQETVSGPEEQPKKEQLIYIGPNIPGGFLAQHTIFRNGVPKYLEEIRKRYPQVDTLIIPVAQLLEAQAQLQRKGTALQQAYQALSRKE
ncbi:hypothetical protein P9G84_03905 [Brevibacillus centrosporus]|uniref:hypothetical protein n=1 Tax=Brevibacillus centrosporus TaxID=54910 RepID=UPI000F0A3D45|nr:hypothetical protein [Brevibacillus centrosporus]MEC2128136.1 hypothetical protein [Brevibacillus centrosporus]RNB63808.1 hypothetical protein EDM55_28285 [Brevibacillus centrosporus]